MEVGKGYVLAKYDGSVPPYTPTNAYIGCYSKEVPFNVSAYTRLEMAENSKNMRLIRGKSFSVEGSVVELFKDNKNTDTKVILGIADVDQMELHIKNLDENEEIQITNIKVEYKSEGRFTISGTAPYNLDVGTASLRLVFKGSKNGYYLGDEITSYHEIWADTIIKLLVPEPRTIEGVDAYVLEEDIRQSLYDMDSSKFLEPGLVFQFQLVEKTETGEPKPVKGGKISLTINSSYSVFRNFSFKYTDDYGIVNFTFNKPLTDTDWGYTLAQSDPEELIINVEFSGKDYYLPSKMLPIQTTHWPPEKESPPSWEEEWGWLIWAVVIIVIVFLVVFFFAMRWYTKQQRIRGMRRIIKRAADQFVVRVTLRPGTNSILLKSCNQIGGYVGRSSSWSFLLRFTAVGGGPLEGVQLWNQTEVGQ